jgi:hypothetical protein
MEAPVMVVKEAAPAVENEVPADAPQEQGEVQAQAAVQEQHAQQEEVVI